MKCKQHKLYKGAFEPRNNCLLCWVHYFSQKMENDPVTAGEMAKILSILVGIGNENEQSARNAAGAAQAALDVINHRY